MKLTILSTSDTHGYIFPTNYVEKGTTMPFGLTRAATVIHRESQTDGAVLTVDNGDFLEGSPLAYYVAKVEPEHDPKRLMAIYNLIPYDVGVLGNHEFNYGQEYLQSAVNEAKRDILCANILDENGDTEYGSPYKIYEKEGIRIGVLGLTTQAVYKWEKPTNISGLQFDSVVATARHYIPIIREQADVVVVCYHGGFERDLLTGKLTDIHAGENEAYTLLEQIPGIDALVTGHQHRKLATKIFDVPVTQPGSRGEDVGKITLNLQRLANGKVSVISSEAELIPTGDATLDSDMMAKSHRLDRDVDHWLDQPLGHINGSMTFNNAFKARIRETPYIEFVQKVQMASVGADISATALFNDEARGFENPITMRNIMTNYVYPNGVSLLEITGEDLRDALELTANYFIIENGQLAANPAYITPKRRQYNYDMYEGIDYVLNIANPVGSRVTKLMYHGQPVTDKMRLKIALNQYRAVGGGHYPMYNAQKIISESSGTMSELIADYLRDHPVIDATTNDNFHVINEPN
ncbi:bifunctional metallophosphatase/5'-nucleotidase [Levilactobacillus bambusae]|uniref:Bifunctional metallophosphatase/5'-nucleotidase n=1 Tax=Levilactobacillus bambusae TaxID=2024736 RepID=A0A2V1MYI7_9LACO|nr:bifunctional metallophosphatase/5'-nucleotidase [Levilactobacillus bambusae]PWF99832.1 bifunctional metallophosphatase/5'-nucleotidase [Levilactobacillus bambusae]